MPVAPQPSPLPVPAPASRAAPAHTVTAPDAGSSQPTAMPPRSCCRPPRPCRTATRSSSRWGKQARRMRTGARASTVRGAGGGCRASLTATCSLALALGLAVRPGMGRGRDPQQDRVRRGLPHELHLHGAAPTRHRGRRRGPSDAPSPDFVLVTPHSFAPQITAVGDQVPVWLERLDSGSSLAPA